MTALSLFLLILLLIIGILIFQRIRKMSKELRERLSTFYETGKKQEARLKSAAEQTKELSTKVRHLEKEVSTTRSQMDAVTITLSEFPDVVSNVRYLKNHRTQSSPSIAKIGGQWRVDGQQRPSPHQIKRANIRRLAQSYGCATLVETGTFQGDMVEAMLPHFEKIFSIELNEDFHRKALQRFVDQPKVTLVQGDSGEKIREIISDLESPTLFWLDGHFSGSDTACADLETPIIKELEHLFSAPDPGHVILIDDARLFIGENDYPTLDGLEKFVLDNRPEHEFAVHDDAIWIMPRK